MTHARRLRSALALGTGIILATLVGGSAVILQRTRDTALHGAMTRLENAALIAQNTVNRQLLQVDSVLASLPAMFAAATSQDGPIDRTSGSRLLRAFYFETFAFRDLLLVRPDGTLWASARPLPAHQPLPFSLPTRTDPSDPGHGPAHPGGVIIQGPVRNALTGSWSWFLMRPILLPGVGELEAVAEIPVPFIMTLLAPVGDVSGLRINLERPDGVLLASLPHDEVRIGRTVEPAGSRHSAEGSVTLTRSAVPDGDALFIWEHTLYPDVDITLTLDVARATRDWHRDRDRLVVVVAIASVLVLAFAASLFVTLRQHQRLEAERKASRDMLDSAIDAMSDGFVMWDEADRLITCNQRYRDIYAISAHLLTPGVRFEQILRDGASLGQYPGVEGDAIDAFVRETVAWRRSNAGSLERLLPDGIWLLIRERRIPTGGFVGIRTDITAIKRAASDLALANQRVGEAMAELQQQNETLVERDHALRTQNMLFDAALNNMSQGLLMMDSDHRLIVCNRRFLDMFRIGASQCSPGTTAATLFRTIEASGGLGHESARYTYEQHELLAGSQRPGSFVVTEDDRFALSVLQRQLPDGGWIATYEDVTERHRAEGRIHFMAHHDSLTRLPNRVLFRNSMEHALRQLGETGRRLALLYLDLDRFKLVNDTLGHPTGDALLEAVADRLRDCVRSSDFVARLGGDEFAIIHSSPRLHDTATGLATRIIGALSAPYRIGDRSVEVGVSVGIAIANNAEVDSDTLLKNADVALYQAKARNRGTYCIFEPEMEMRLHARMTFESDLRTALGDNQFVVYYQPFFNLNNGALSGFEALLRWKHPDRGLVPPGQFIPIAEETGLIKPIGAWLIRQVCADAARLPSHLKIAANLSPVQLEDGEIVDVLTQSLAQSNLPPERIEVEITESALLNNSAATVALLLRLNRMGISIALDDFGTGFSSLSYLRSFPFNKIKIDRLFVSEMTTRGDCAAIVSSVVMLARKLGMTTTAEGVETEEQLRLVREAGCTIVQGYLLGRPQPLARILETLPSGRPVAGAATRETELAE
jgi:diguanylate cyclase (GGDEF)-like protein